MMCDHNILDLVGYSDKSITKSTLNSIHQMLKSIMDIIQHIILVSDIGISSLSQESTRKIPRISRGLS